LEGKSTVGAKAEKGKKFDFRDWGEQTKEQVQKTAPLKQINR